MELNIFHIEYEPRTPIKGQVLVDFIADFTNNSSASIRGHQESVVALAN